MSAGDCTRSVLDPGAAAISQGKHNTTEPYLPCPAVPCRVVLTEVDPTGQVSDIISAEHCQHSSTLLPFTPYSGAGAAGGGGGGGVFRHSLRDIIQIYVQILSDSRWLLFRFTSLPEGSDRIRAHPTKKKKKKPFSLYIFCEIIQIWTGPGLVRS